MIISAIPIANHRYAGGLNSKRPAAPRTYFKGQSDHVHGPDCQHHHHSHGNKPHKKATNPVFRFFQSIYGWFKEFFQGIWQDFFGKGGQPPKPHSQPHTHNGKPCHEHHISTHP